MTATSSEEQAQITAAQFPLEPLDDIVVIEQLTEEKSSGGIVLPGKFGELPCGRVVAVGPGRIFSTILDASGHQQVGVFVPTRVKVGDWVIFGRYQSGGEPIEWNGRKFIMCREGDLGGRSKNGESVKIRRVPAE